MPPTKLPENIKCCICGDNATISKLDEKRRRTGIYFCAKHYANYYDHIKRDRKTENKERYLRDRRIGTLDPNSSQAKGDNFEELTSIWKGVKILSKENDNYTGPLDHSANSEGIVYQTKGKFYDPCNDCWKQSLTNEHRAIIAGFKFDYLILYCVSKDGKIIERIYIFPFEDVLIRSSIHIVRTIVQGYSLYDKYRLNDKEVIKRVNSIWQKIVNKVR